MHFSFIDSSAAEGEGVEPPGPFRAVPVFGQLSYLFRRTLRFRSQMNHRHYSSQTSLSSRRQDSNLQLAVLSDPASAKLGYQSDVDTVELEGVEPSFPGCRPGVFPLDDSPNFSALRDGFEPSSSAFGGPRSSNRAIATSTETMKSER